LCILLVECCPFVVENARNKQYKICNNAEAVLNRGCLGGGGGQLAQPVAREQRVASDKVTLPARTFDIRKCLLKLFIW
jgi:hypothetical protein